MFTRSSTISREPCRLGVGLSECPWEAGAPLCAPISEPASGWLPAVAPPCGTSLSPLSLPRAPVLVPQTGRAPTPPVTAGVLLLGGARGDYIGRFGPVETSCLF